MIELEPYLDTAAEALRVNLRTKLLALDADLPIPLDDGGAVGAAGTDYYVGVVQKPLRYPLVEIAVADWNMTEFSLATLTAMSEFPLLASATLRTADLSTDRLYRMLMRYTRAMLNVLLDQNLWDAGGRVTSVRGAYRQNPEDREDVSAVLGATVLALTIESTDTRDV